MRKFWIYLLLLIINVSCVTMSQEDFKEIKKVAVINEIDNSIFIKEKGLTVFENSPNINGSIENWELSQYLSKKTIDYSSEKAPGRIFKTIVDSKLKNVTKETKSLLEENGFDTLLKIEKVGIYNPVGGGYYEVAPKYGGFIIYSRSILGAHAYTRICAKYSLVLRRIRDWKLLGAAKSKTTCESTDLKVDDFKKYDESQLNEIRRVLTKVIDANIENDVSEIFEVQTSQKVRQQK